MLFAHVRLRHELASRGRIVSRRSIEFDRATPQNEHENEWRTSDLVCLSGVGALRLN